MKWNNAFQCSSSNFLRIEYAVSGQGSEMIISETILTLFIVSVFLRRLSGSSLQSNHRKQIWLATYLDLLIKMLNKIFLSESICKSAIFVGCQTKTNYNNIFVCKITTQMKWNFTFLQYKNNYRQKYVQIQLIYFYSSMCLWRHLKMYPEMVTNNFVWNLNPNLILFKLFRRVRGLKQGGVNVFVTTALKSHH